MTGPAGPLAVLGRIRASRPDPARQPERCDLCGRAVPGGHAHVVDVANRTLRCSCRPCYLLFTSENATIAYRAVPERYLSFPGFTLAPGQWDALQVPVGVAFFFTNSALGHPVAFYPSPAGATESELPMGAWDEIVAANPGLATVRPDVEAVLVRQRSGGTLDCWLVPIDCCYEVVGRLRTLWRGFDGQDARTWLDGFFAELAARARPAAARAANQEAQ